MKNIISLLILFLVLAVVGISGCTDSGTKTYSEQGIAFNYPDAWTIGDDNWIHTSDGYGYIENLGSIKKITADLPEYSPTMESVIKIMREDYTDASFEKKEVTVAGVKGIEYIPTSNSNRIDLYFTKGNDVYNIFISSNDIQSNSEGMDTIINTLKFN